MADIDRERIKQNLILLKPLVGKYIKVTAEYSVLGKQADQGYFLGIEVGRDFVGVVLTKKVYVPGIPFIAPDQRFNSVPVDKIVSIEEVTNENE